MNQNFFPNDVEIQNFAANLIKQFGIHVRRWVVFYVIFFRSDFCRGISLRRKFFLFRLVWRVILLDRFYLIHGGWDDEKTG